MIIYRRPYDTLSSCLLSIIRQINGRWTSFLFIAGRRGRLMEAKWKWYPFLSVFNSKWTDFFCIIRQSNWPMETQWECHHLFLSTFHDRWIDLLASSSFTYCWTKRSTMGVVPIFVSSSRLDELTFFWWLTNKQTNGGIMRATPFFINFSWRTFFFHLLLEE
jgi:hypothetical protein